MNVRRQINLADPNILQILTVTLDDILRDQWWLAGSRGEESISQAIGRAAHACSVEALVAPPAQPIDDGVNLVLFPDNTAASALKVVRGRSPR